MARAHLKIIGTYKALALATFYKADYSVSREEGEEERNRIRGRGKVSPVSPFRTDESCRNSMYQSYDGKRCIPAVTRLDRMK